MTTDKKMRSFRAKLLDDNESEFKGHFTGRTPTQAGKKAIRSLLNDNNKETGTIKFEIKEITQGTRNKNKTYQYQGTKTEKNDTVPVTRKGLSEPILYKYDTHIKSLK